MIKNLVFDLGNVLVTFKPKEYLKRLGFSETETDRLVKLIFKDKRWNEFDRGTITIEEYISELKAENPDDAENFDKIFCENWVENMFQPKEDEIFFLKTLSNRYNIYILSNVSEYVFSYIEKMDFFEYVSGGTYSYKLGICKPEPCIYKEFLKEHYLEPEECLFLDDLPKNIQVAKKFGIHGIVYHDNIQEIIRILDLQP